MKLPNALANLVGAAIVFVTPFVALYIVSSLLLN